MAKINVIFKTKAGRIQNATLSPPSQLELPEFLSVVETLFGPTNNVKYLIKGTQLNTKDEAQFRAKRHLLYDKCIVQMVQNMIGGSLQQLLVRVQSEIPNTFKANANNSKTSCQACLETRQCMKFSCQSCNQVHILCIDCGIQYFTINDFLLKCFQCKNSIDYCRVFSNSASFVQILNDLHEIYETAKNIDCQICACGEFQVNETLFSKQYCQQCRRWYCFFCNTTWDDTHMRNDKFTCHNNCQYENATTFDPVPLSGNATVKIPNRRTCPNLTPKCLTLGAYGDACQMHTCRQCGYKFCFICLREQTVCHYNQDKKCVLAYQSYEIFPKSTD